MRFDNRRVIITGAASGIGAAAATVFAAEGAAVALADVNTTRQARSGGGLIAIEVDAIVTARSPMLFVRVLL